MRGAIPDGHTFALCLTHDVDRPYKTYQSLYYAIRDRSRYHLKSLLPGRNPYWQFEELMDLERDLGVRSAFYFLNEPPVFAKEPRDWVRPDSWIEHFGRYDVTDPDIADVVRALDEGGWEVGLHGSTLAHRDEDRLRFEKRMLESVLGREVRGGRQHHMLLERPETWQSHAAVGLDYDASLGSSSEFGFDDEYGIQRPFDDDFVVFPLSLMEVALPGVRDDPETAWAACERLLAEAVENEAVMTVLWHPRYFSSEDFPGYRRIYARLVERAAELGAWIGPPGDLYERLESDERATPVHSTN